ncbi:50S ribosomal protein L29 [bacterium]|nr:50S ribosomal protein L29 [bacterium]
MKTDELKKWREATEEEIDRKIDELKKQKFNMLTQVKMGQLKDYSALKKLKKDIAVLKTIKNEKKRKING